MSMLSVGPGQVAVKPSATVPEIAGIFEVAFIVNSRFLEES